MSIATIVTDIEGTTSAIDFVHQVLFPYARENLGAFVRAHGHEPEVAHWLHATAAEAGLAADDTDAIVATLLEWIAADRKATPLKALQGMVWKDGYAAGAYRAHLYPEVAACLRAWQAQGIQLYVYSSGSVQAQQLFFGHSQAGDLRPLLSGYFDTTTGPKQAVGSYRTIARAIDREPADILFLSDTVAELQAAHAAGLHVTRLCRPPTDCPAHAPWPCVRDFSAVRLP